MLQRLVNDMIYLKRLNQRKLPLTHKLTKILARGSLIKRSNTRKYLQLPLLQPRPINEENLCRGNMLSLYSTIDHDGS